MKCLLKLAVFLLTAHMAVEAADVPLPKPMIGNLAAGKVLYLGNSITLHGPAPAIGWTGNWGMAASAKEKDYVQLLTAEIGKLTGSPPEIKVRNIADFERGYGSFGIEKELKDELHFQADLVIVAIGENVAELANDEARNKFAAAFAKLLSVLKQHGQPTILVRSSFWPHPFKDDILRKASADAGVTFVDIAKVGREPANVISSERKIEHAGVAAHPGDKGMKAIADALYAAIRRKGEMAEKVIFTVPRELGFADGGFSGDATGTATELSLPQMRLLR